jgi:demethylmenaquinone methyltransferase/2-methoxy-6-polyprenyl-1,4-benzoquinol methylase
VSTKESVHPNRRGEPGTICEGLEVSRTACFGYWKIPYAEKVRWVNRHFNVVAPKYDFMNTLLSFGIHHLWKRTAVRMLALRPGDRVLDLCGGTGDLALLAARVVGPSGRVVLYDLNRPMMELGRVKTDRHFFVGRIAYVQGDAQRISVADQSFDAAMVGFGIRNLTDLEEGFREMYRVLRPGGKIMCLEFSMPVAPLFRWLYDFYSFHVMPWLGILLAGSREAYTYLPESIRTFPLPEELSKILRTTGFTSVTYHLLTNGIAAIHLGTKYEARGVRRRWSEASRKGTLGQGTIPWSVFP